MTNKCENEIRCFNRNEKSATELKFSDKKETLFFNVFLAITTHFSAFTSVLHVQDES